MLAASRERLLASLSDAALVLDVGGWADPIERADWVIDLMPYASRGLYERQGWVEPRSRDAERFDASRWVQRDICDRDPWPFEDDQFDFVVCSHTLEDVRDPVWVCSELCRVARAGYVEVPSRLEEQSYGVNGPSIGWPHHRWLIEIGDGAIEFVMKPHSLHARSDQHFPAGFWAQLEEHERVETLWWEGGFEYRERIFVDALASDAYLSSVVLRERARRPRAFAPASEPPHAKPAPRTVVRRLRSRLARALRPAGR